MSKTIKGRLKNLDKYIQSKWEEHYWNFLMKYEDKLSWDYISNNKNITMQIIENNPKKPWGWYYISINPNITMKFIENNPDKNWDWSYVSLNTFKKEKELFYEKWYRKYMATFRLQQYFNRMYDNPDYKFCRDRIEKLFS